jgi:hypothetical protein
MRHARRVWGEWSPWSPAIRDSDIRRWAIAVYWPDTPPRRYWDQTFANSTRVGGIVAPEDFNPFAWPPPITSGSTKRPQLDRQPDPQRVRRRVNGGCRAIYGVPMRPGDSIRRRVRLHSWKTAQGSRGPLLLVDYEHEWHNQHGELVRTAVYTLIYS